MPLKNGDWDYSTVTEGVSLLLDMFDEFAISATFFVSSDVAKNFKWILNKIIKNGHEVGCHGYNHQALDLGDPQEQYTKLKEATRIIRDQVGSVLAGFRAPFSRIDETTLPTLIKLGYKYDSSVVPSPRIFSRYYFPKAPHEPYRPSNARIDMKGQSAIIEIPVSTLPLIGPPLGLSYCMLFGLNFYKSLLCNFNHEVMTLYVHNYDFYPIPGNAKVSSRFKLPYLRQKEKRIKVFRELLQFSKEKLSSSFVCAREMLRKFQPLN